MSRCLPKDKNERLHDIADARIELKDAASSSRGVASGAGPSSAGGSASHWRRRNLVWGALALGAGLLGVVAIARLQTGPVAPLPRLTFGAPRGAALATQNNSTQHLSLAPDGRRIAFMAGGKIFEREVTAIESRMLVDRGHTPFVSPLFAVPFDAASLRVTGEATPVVDDVHMSLGGHFYADSDIAPSGDLAYVPGFPKAIPRALLWVGRNGQATPANEEKRDYSKPQLSPDGRPSSRES